jgi:4-amino-4-deoxy-L-arabinose transferase-like glycosyltransferase
MMATPMPRHASLFLWAAVLFGSLPRADAVSRMFPADRDQRTDVRRYYMSMATSALEGRGFLPSYPTNFIPPPGQALFLYVLKLVWPSADYQHFRSVQALVSIVTILLAYAAAAQLHDAWSGVLCAWLVALDYRLSQMVGVLLAETNHVFLLFAFVALFLLALGRPRRGAFLGSGVVLGLACLFKPTPTLLAPVMAIVLALAGPRPAGIRRALTLLAGFGLALAPWTVRNLVHYGHIYPISTNGGTLLALSNSPGLDSARPEMRYWDDLYTLPYYKDAAIETAFAGQVDTDGKPEENLKDRAYLGNALRYMVHRPWHFARNYLYKLRNFVWYPTPEAAAAGPFPFRELPGLTRAVVFAGLASATWLLWRGRKDPAGASVAIVLLYLLAFGSLYHLTRDGRMSLPFEALAAIPAAVGTTRLAQSLRARITRAGTPATTA